MQLLYVLKKVRLELMGVKVHIPVYIYRSSSRYVALRAEFHRIVVDWFATSAPDAGMSIWIGSKTPGALQKHGPL